MDLENTYYVLAIIFMILGISMLVAIGIVLFYIKKKVNDIYDMVEEKIEEISKLAERPVDVAAGLGAIAAKSAKKILQKR